jgi:hypothetical protein
VSPRPLWPPADWMGRPGVAVDGAGDVFIAAFNNSEVVEVPAGGGAQITVGSGLAEPVRHCGGWSR